MQAEASTSAIAAPVINLLEAEEEEDVAVKLDKLIVSWNDQNTSRDRG